MLISFASCHYHCRGIDDFATPLLKVEHLCVDENVAKYFFGTIFYLTYFVWTNIIYLLNSTVLCFEIKSRDVSRQFERVSYMANELMKYEESNELYTKIVSLIKSRKTAI